MSQNYTPCIPLLTKNASLDFALLPPPGVDCLPFSRTFLGNSGDEARIPPKSQKVAHSPHQKKFP